MIGGGGLAPGRLIPYPRFRSSPSRFFGNLLMHGGDP
jgi:hypothetical protein